MPAAEDLPTIQQYVNAYQGGLVSLRKHGDTHAGSIHDHWAGVGAVLWRRQAERDREEFRALYFRDAKGNRLDNYIARHFPGKARVTNQPGSGVVRLSRASAALGGGTFWDGTRIAVGGVGPNPLRYYLIDQDQGCGTDLAVVLNVRADREGPESEINVRSGERAVLRVEDPLWDNTWQVDALTCGAGTVREDDDPCRARIAGEVFEERFGYESAIIKRMKQAGAETVALFRSDYLGEGADHGLNRIYVGDRNFETTSALLTACRLAIPSVAMAGAGNQTLPMTTQMVDIKLEITFWDSPERFAMAANEKQARAAAVEYFETRENPFTWDMTGLRGAVQRALEDTQSIAITSSQVPPVLATLFDAYPLPRFRTTPQRVSVSLHAPA